MTEETKNPEVNDDELEMLINKAQEAYTARKSRDEAGTEHKLKAMAQGVKKKESKPVEIVSEKKPEETKQSIKVENQEEPEMTLKQFDQAELDKLLKGNTMMKCTQTSEQHIIRRVNSMCCSTTQFAKPQLLQHLKANTVPMKACQCLAGAAS